MQSTSIQWTNRSANPIRARRVDGKHRIPGHFCQKIKPECANCYASHTQPRFGLPMFPGTNKSAADMGVEVFLDERVLKAIMGIRKPCKLFICDMTDLFGEWVPFEMIDRIFAAMALTPHVTFQVLTKRPDRMASYLQRGGEEAEGRISWQAAQLFKEHAPPECYPHSVFDLGCDDEGKIDSIHLANWPLPNVWLGTSCGTQSTADEFIPHLLKCPAEVRFLSCEPLLSGVNLWRLNGYEGGTVTNQYECAMGNRVNWVIVGGESGRNARPCNVAWIRSIVNQCKAAGVACFVKQLGANTSASLKETGTDEADDDNIERLELEDKKGGNPEEWPSDLRVRQFPNVAIGGGK